jgi:hypothetical protein
MAERVLTTRELNRALLARQLLLERSPLPLTRALERIGGLQTQYAPSGYVGLWSRLAGFEREALTRALERRTVVQAWLMRMTIHMVSAPDFWPIAAAVREARRIQYGRAARSVIGGIDMEAVARRVRELLSGGPRRGPEMQALLEAEGIPRQAWVGAGLWVDLVRVPPSGTWERRRADLYGLADDWLGPTKASVAEGTELLVRRYLSGFGPASAKDAASFTGLTPRELQPVLERVGSRRFRDESGGLLYDLPGAPLPDAATPAPPRFIPTWDATLLVHARRTQILPEEHRPKVFSTKTPHSIPTFLVDGRVAGSWRHEDGRITLGPFERLGREVRAELEAEAERLAAFHA